jgi:hypothetical protein
VARTDIPKNVRQLILRHIDSVQQVEILALLRDEPERDWTPAEISRALQINGDACRDWMTRFAQAGLADRTDRGFRHPRGGRTSAAADELVDYYARRRLAVIDSIYNKPSAAIQSFSDAFRMRRED